MARTFIPPIHSAFLVSDSMAKLTIKSRYGIAPNELLNDPEISLKAKGLFTFMQAKPDEWDFSVARIAKQCKEGKEAIQHALQELEKAGYLKRTSCKNSDGTWDGYDYLLSDLPLAGNQPTGERLTEKPATISKKDSSKQDIVNKKENSEQSSQAKSLDQNLIVAIVDAFVEINPACKRLYGNKTQRCACLDLVKTYGLDRTLKAVEYVKHTRGEMYAPVITTPHELWTKWSKLEAWGLTKKLGKKKHDITVASL
jgi:hypothetical protein